MYVCVSVSYSMLMFKSFALHDFGMSPCVFIWNFENVSEQLFHKTSPGECLCQGTEKLLSLTTLDITVIFTVRMLRLHKKYLVNWFDYITLKIRWLDIVSRLYVRLTFTVRKHELQKIQSLTHSTKTFVRKIKNFSN